MTIDHDPVEPTLDPVDETVQEGIGYKGEYDPHTTERIAHLLKTSVEVVPVTDEENSDSEPAVAPGRESTIEKLPEDTVKRGNEAIWSTREILNKLHPSPHARNRSSRSAGN